MSTDPSRAHGAPDDDDAFRDVLSAEDKEIEARRECAFGTDPSMKAWTSSESLKNQKIGLALSGGGIRSAMFNLGLLQAFMHRGLMRYVDYISSVSGGGYSAGYLASEVQKAAAATCFHDLDKSVAAQEDGPDPELGVDAQTQQHEDGYPFKQGAYLNDVIGLAWRYIVFGTPLFFLYFSALGMIACLLALFWRSFDHEMFRVDFTGLGLSRVLANELLVALFPTLGLTFFLWLPFALLRAFDTCMMRKVAMISLRLLELLLCVACAVATGVALANHDSMSALWLALPLVYTAQAGYWRFRRDFRRSLRFAYALIIVSVGLFSLVYHSMTSYFFILWALLYLCFSQYLKTVGDLGSEPKDGLVQTQRWFFRICILSLFVAAAVFLGNGETSIYPNQQFLQLNYFIAWLTLAAAVVQLVTLLGSDSLLRSSQEDAPAWKKWFFSIVTHSAIVAPIFVMVHWMSRENISQFATHRDPDFHRWDVTDWQAFQNVVRDHCPSQPPVMDALLTNVAIADVEATEALYQVRGRPIWEAYDRRPTSSVKGAASMLWQAATTPFVSNNLSSYRSRCMRRKEAAERYVGRFNGVLGTRDLTARLMREVQKSASETPSPKESSKSLVSDGRYYPTEIEGRTQASAVPKSVFPEEFVFDRVYAARYATEVKDLKEFWRKAATGSMTLWLEIDVKRFNRLLLEVLYPTAVRPRKMVTTSMLPPYDQSARMWWLAVWGVIFLFCVTVVDFNSVAPIYNFYWHKLRARFTDRTAADPPLLSSALRVDSGKREAGDGSTQDGSLALKDLNTCQSGMPYHLFCCAVQLRVKGETEGSSEIENLPFILTAKHCSFWDPRHGSHAKLTEYRTSPELRLADAVTLSASAVTPLMNGNLPLSTLMHAFSLSLGQWLPRPNNQIQAYSTGGPIRAARRWLARGASAVALEREIWGGFKRTNHFDWDLGFVADGGFRDFLGVEELIRRRCRLIIVTDAGCNSGKNEFESLADTIRMARRDHGVEFLDLDHNQPVDADRFRRRKNEADSTDCSPQQFLCLRVRYPRNSGIEGPTEGLLFYVQMSLTGKEEVDLQQFRKRHPNFPDEPTSNQFFTQGQVESYRQLGYHIGAILCREMPPFRDQPAYQLKDGVEREISGERRKWLTFSEVEGRLRLAYMSECLREVDFDQSDLRSHSLFAKSWGLGVPEGRHDDPFVNDHWWGKTPNDWLHRYEYDADFRLHHRQRVYNLMRQKTVEPPREMHLEAEAGRLATTMLAYHELLCEPQSENSWERVYQIDGRTQLICYSRLIIWELIIGHPRPDDQQVRDELNIELSDLFIPLISLGREVFRQAGERTIAHVITDYLFPTPSKRHRALECDRIRRAIEDNNVDELRDVLTHGRTPLWSRCWHVARIAPRFAFRNGKVLRFEEHEST